MFYPSDVVVRVCQEVLASAAVPCTEPEVKILLLSQPRLKNVCRFGLMTEDDSGELVELARTELTSGPVSSRTDQATDRVFWLFKSIL